MVNLFSCYRINHVFYEELVNDSTNIFDNLKRTTKHGFTWKVLKHGEIRGYLPGNSRRYCPIMAVYKMKVGLNYFNLLSNAIEYLDLYSIGNYERTSFPWDIIYGSDAKTICPKTRAKIMKAVGLL
jgi:hypothetical protein